MKNRVIIILTILLSGGLAHAMDTMPESYMITVKIKNSSTDNMQLDDMVKEAVTIKPGAERRTLLRDNKKRFALSQLTPGNIRTGTFQVIAPHDGNVTLDGEALLNMQRGSSISQENMEIIRQ